MARETTSTMKSCTYSRVRNSEAFFRSRCGKVRLSRPGAIRFIGSQVDDVEVLAAVRSAAPMRQVSMQSLLQSSSHASPGRVHRLCRIRVKPSSRISSTFVGVLSWQPRAGSSWRDKEVLPPTNSGARTKILAGHALGGALAHNSSTGREGGQVIFLL
jgi:hypothetical protein